MGGVGGTVTNVTVQLDITGGFNGSLYAYLVDPAGQLVVLLNRSGVTGGNPFGYGDAGMNLTLSGSVTNDIHYYQSGGYSLNGGGQVTGTWAADGRNIDPQSAGSVFSTTSSAAGLNLYTGLNGGDMNGTWTLFIADMVSGGGNATLQSVVLSIMTVPEPQTWIMIGGGLALLWQMRKRH